MFRTPALAVVNPLYVFGVVKVKVFAPPLVKLNVAEPSSIKPLKVAASPLPVVKVRFPLLVLVTFPEPAREAMVSLKPFKSSTVDPVLRVKLLTSGILPAAPN
jgi:hypothetical protein